MIVFFCIDQDGAGQFNMILKKHEDPRIVITCCLGALWAASPEETKMNASSAQLYFNGDCFEDLTADNVAGRAEKPLEAVGTRLQRSAGIRG